MWVLIDIALYIRTLIVKLPCSEYSASVASQYTISVTAYLPSDTKVEVTWTCAYLNSSLMYQCYSYVPSTEQQFMFLSL